MLDRSGGGVRHGLLPENPRSTETISELSRRRRNTARSSLRRAIATATLMAIVLFQRHLSREHGDGVGSAPGLRHRRELISDNSGEEARRRARPTLTAQRRRPAPRFLAPARCAAWKLPSRRCPPQEPGRARSARRRDGAPAGSRRELQAWTEHRDHRSLSAAPGSSIDSNCGPCGWGPQPHPLARVSSTARRRRKRSIASTALARPRRSTPSCPYRPVAGTEASPPEPGEAARQSQGGKYRRPFVLALTRRRVGRRRNQR